MHKHNKIWPIRFAWQIIAMIMLIGVVYNLAYAGSPTSSEEKLIHRRPKVWPTMQPDNPLSTSRHSIDPEEISVIPAVPLLGGISLFR